MATSILEPVIDASIRGKPDFRQSTNYGSSVFAEHGVNYFGGDKNDWWRSVAEWDISGLIGRTVTAAKIVRNMTRILGGGATTKVSRITRPGDMVESEVSWKQYSSGNSWTNDGGDFEDIGPPAAFTYTEPSSLGIHEITDAALLTLVDDALDNRSGLLSLIFLLDDEDPVTDEQYQCQSEESTALPWTLVLEYTSPDPGRRSTPARQPAGPSRSPLRRPHLPASAARHATPSRPHAPRRKST